MQTHFNVLGATHFLDDYIFFGPANESTCLHSLLSFERLADDIGIPLNTGKRRPPSTCQVVYGIEIDTTAMELRLPADKLAKALSLVNRMSNCRKVTLRDLLSLIGLLSYCCLVVSAGRSFLRLLINLASGITRLHHYVTLNRAASADLYAWKLFLHSFNGKSLFLEQILLSSDTIKLYTDASSDNGFSVVFGKKWIAGAWHKRFDSSDITLLELYPLVLATEMFGQYLSNQCILFMSDNSGVVDIINKNHLRESGHYEACPTTGTGMFKIQYLISGSSCSGLSKCHSRPSFSFAVRESQTDSSLARPHSSHNHGPTKATGTAGLEQELIRASLAPTTRASYRRSVNMLRQYVSSACPGTRFSPVSRTNLAGFITHLFSANYASSTILSIVSAISYSHKIVGLADPADNFYIKQLLVGVQKSSGKVDSRKPIDLHML